MKENVLKWISGHDKLVHAIVCFLICVCLGVAAASVAAITKEGADEYHKRVNGVGSGWDWKDIMADAVGILLGYLIRLILFK